MPLGTVLGFALVAMAALLLALALRERLPPAPPRADSRTRLPRVSIVVPSRNEAHNLPRLLESLTRLDHPHYEVLVVDGGSTDGSRDIVRAFARRDARVRLLEEPPLEPGWVGKSWACRHACAFATGEWLLFTDADTWHAPDSLRRAQADALANQAGLLTGFTRQELRSFWERVAMPAAFTMLQAAMGGVAGSQDPDKVIGNGQYLLFERGAYERAGGHAQVRGSIVEDLAIARAAASRGVNVRLVDLSALVRVRMYRGLREMFVGWRKNVATGAQVTPPLPYALTVLTYFVGLATLPASALLAATGSPAGAALALAAYLATSWRVRLAHAGTDGAKWRHAFAHPAGYAFFGAVLLASTLDRLTGRGAVWKGRRYAQQP